MKLFETLAFFGPLWQLTEWLAWPHKRLHAARMAVVNRGVDGACSAPGGIGLLAGSGGEAD